MKIDVEIPDLREAGIDGFEFICEQERFVLESIVPPLVSMYGLGIETHMESEAEMVERLTWDREFARDVAALRRVGERLIRVANAVQANWAKADAKENAGTAALTPTESP